MPILKNNNPYRHEIWHIFDIVQAIFENIIHEMIRTIIFASSIALCKINHIPG